MLVINSANVRFLKSTVIPLDHSPKFLEYFSNLYELISTFSASHQIQATDLWRELTDNSSTVCLLVQEVDSYSVWGLTNQKVDCLENYSANLPLAASEVLPDLALWLGQSLWLIIGDLAGVDRAESFNIDVVNSDLLIATGSDCRVHKPLHFVMDKHIQLTENDKINSIVEEFQQLAAKYLGHSCAKQVLQDIVASLDTTSNSNI
jgi:hypothetical protein